MHPFTFPTDHQAAAAGVFFLLVGVLLLWEIVWKAVGLWKAGRNNQLAWFIFILIFNTAGILPIIYILFFQRPHSETK